MTNILNVLYSDTMSVAASDTGSFMTNPAFRSGGGGGVTPASGGLGPRPDSKGVGLVRHGHNASVRSVMSDSELEQASVSKKCD